MADPVFTAYNGVTSEIVQPSYTRMRHRFRGQRESAKFNLDAHQMYYEINRLLAQMEDLEDFQSYAQDTLYGEGAPLPSGITLTTLDVDDLDINEAFVDITALVEQVENLHRRVNNMFETET